MGAMRMNKKRLDWPRLRRLFPVLWPVMGLYFALNFKRETEVSPLRRLRLVYAGIRGGKTMKVYEETADR